MGDQFVGMIDGSQLTVTKIGKDPSFYGTESGNLYQDKETYVHFRNEATGKVNRTILQNAQRLLLRRESF